MVHMLHLNLILRLPCLRLLSCLSSEWYLFATPIFFESWAHVVLGLH